MNHHVRWDEATIAEHDKDRGTRMVIDEPDTPFVRSPPNEGESCSSSCSLQTASRFNLPPEGEGRKLRLPQEGEGRKLSSSSQDVMDIGAENSRGNNGLKKSDQGGASASNTSPLRESDVGLRLEQWLQNPMIEEEDRTSPKKENDFAKMRKQHYNEFEMIKRMKAEGMSLDDEDEEDEDSAEKRPVTEENNPSN